MNEVAARQGDTGTGDGDGTKTSGSALGNRFQSGLVGYEVTEEELTALAREIEAESKQDGLSYILDAMTSILVSETSPALLTKLFGLWAVSSRRSSRREMDGAGACVEPAA